MVIVVLYVGGLPYSVESNTASSAPYSSLIANITCTSNENSISECIVNKQQDCMKICDSLLGLYCYSKLIL